MGGTTRDEAPPAWMLVRRVALGVVAGWLAGIPQVGAAQVVGGLVGKRRQADVGPRFVQRAARLLGKSPSRPSRWSLATLFHFLYAAGWGALYATTVGAVGTRRVPPLLGAGLLGALIYGAAFSRVGAGTATRTERHPDRRPPHEWAVEGTSAFSFALVLAYLWRWLDGRLLDRAGGTNERSNV
jgi:hypothetical protein